MLKNTEKTFKISITLVCWALLAIACIYLIRYFSDLVAILAITTAVTYILLWPTKAIENLLPDFKKINKRVIATTITYIIASIIIALTSVLLIQPISKQTVELAQTLPKNLLELEYQAIEYVNHMSTQYGLTVADQLLEESPKTEVNKEVKELTSEEKTKAQAAVIEFKLSKELQTLAKHGVSALPDIISSTMRYMIYALLIAILSFYFILSENSFRNWLLTIFKSPDNAKFELIETKIHAALFGYIKGQAIIGLVTGIFMGGIYYLFGLKYALVLAIFMGVGQFVPYLGQALAIIAAMIVGLVQAPLSALIIFFIFLVFQIFSNNILVPKLLGDLTGINPVVIIIALLLGERLAGILGVFLAVPVACIIIILFVNLYKPTKKEETETEEATIPIESSENE